MTHGQDQPKHRLATQRLGYLLSQVGEYATLRFADRLSALSLQPSDVGILRLIAVEPGLSQQALAGRIGVGPSRVVVLIDELEKKGLVSRDRSLRDRRNYELQLTEAGRAVMSRMRTIGSAHEDDIVHALSAQERETLAALLTTIATSHGLTLDVHPRYATPAVQ